MKTISPALQSHFEQAPTTLASCWKVVRTDGESYYFTDHDKDIVFSGDTYISKSGYSRTAIQSNSRFSVDNLDVDAIFDSEVISDKELRAGLFDFAEITVTLVNYKRPQDGGVTMRRGWLGEVLLQDNGIYRTELRGLTQVFSQNVVEVVTPTCRADLGDARCKVPITDPFWAKMGVVETVIDRTNFITSIDDPRAVDGWYDGGLVSWQTGDNSGRAIEVTKWLTFPPGINSTLFDLSLTNEEFVTLAYNDILDRAPDSGGFNFYTNLLETGALTRKGVIAQLVASKYDETVTNEEFVTAVYNDILGREPDQEGLDFYVNELETEALTREEVVAALEAANEGQARVQLFLPVGYNIQVGDTFTIRPGCNKLRTTCVNKFNNILNFRGEPFVPGIDQIMKTGGA